MRELGAECGTARAHFNDVADNFSKKGFWIEFGAKSWSKTAEIFQEYCILEGYCVRKCFSV